MQDEIKPEQWAEFFKAFTQRNMARPTRMQYLGTMGAQEAERHLPLSGISINGKELAIMLGGENSLDARHLSHTITNVRQVFCKLGADGLDEALEIIDAEDKKILLTFETLPALAA